SRLLAFLVSFFSQWSAALRDLPSFPTRRSSDLDQHAGPGGAGEAHHVDALVARERGADAGAVAIDQIEHARGHAGGGEHLGEDRSEEHTSELQSRRDLVCRLLLEKKKKKDTHST